MVCQNFYAQDCSLIWLFVAVWSLGFRARGYLWEGNGGGAATRGKYVKHKVIKTLDYFKHSAQK